jgi:hypothetical protein
MKLRGEKVFFGDDSVMSDLPRRFATDRINGLNIQDIHNSLYMS